MKLPRVDDLISCLLTPSDSLYICMPNESEILSAMPTTNRPPIIAVLPSNIAEYKENIYNDVKIEFPMINSCFAPKLQIKVNSWVDLIEEIKIGPKNKSDIAKSGLRNFLDYNGLTDEYVDITQSDIPVRF